MIKSEQLTLNVVKLSALKAFLIERGMDKDAVDGVFEDALESEYTWGTSLHSLVDLRSLLPGGYAALPTTDEYDNLIVEVNALVSELEDFCASTDEPLFLDLEN